MAKRDPAKTLRNQQIAKLTDEINDLLVDILELTGYENEHSLNAILAFAGGRARMHHAGIGPHRNILRLRCGN